MKKLILSASILIAMALPMYASAAIYCSGNVHNLFVESNGLVIINGAWRGDYTAVCALTGTWNGVAETTCSAWFATLESADAKQEPIMISYRTSTYTCSNLPTYGSAISPNYVMLRM